MNRSNSLLDQRGPLTAGTSGLTARLKLHQSTLLVSPRAPSAATMHHRVSPTSSTWLREIMLMMLTCGHCSITKEFACGQVRPKLRLHHAPHSLSICPCKPTKTFQE